MGGRVPSLKLTTNAPKNGCLEYFFPFLLGQTAYFQGLCLAVSFRVPGISFCYPGVSKNNATPKMDGENFMENPMNKWMIWGGFPTPIFWFNTRILPTIIGFTKSPSSSTTRALDSHLPWSSAPMIQPEA